MKPLTAKRRKALLGMRQQFGLPPAGDAELIYWSNGKNGYIGPETCSADLELTDPIGMEELLSRPLTIDDRREYDRLCRLRDDHEGRGALRLKDLKFIRLMDVAVAQGKPWPAESEAA